LPPKTSLNSSTLVPMGNCADGAVGPQTPESIAIDQQIKQDKRRREIKLLLLGTGDSGKSTFIRQMKALHTSGFHAVERQKFAFVLKQNALDAIKGLITIAQEENFRISKKLDKSVKKVTDNTSLDSSLADDIENLWEDKGILKAWTKRSKYHIPPTASYLFQHISRIASKKYVPSDEDIFRAKLKTTGIVETKFEKDNIGFSIIDVGGQRTERRKWLHCFEEVTSVLYLVALDSFDMKLVEDNTTNRMEDAMDNFKEITSTECFSKTSWILFLNKKDLFEEKLQSQGGVEALQELFPDYNGGGDLNSGIEFFAQKFKDVYSSPSDRSLYIHATCAIDTKNMERVFKAVADTVLQNNLSTNFYF